MANDPDGRRIAERAAQELVTPAKPEALAGEVIWIILCAGRSGQAARTIEKKAWGAIEAGTPVGRAFGCREKAAAIKRAWNERASDFAAMSKAFGSQDPQTIIDWCGSIPFVGPTTKFQLAKNCGITTLCKPDRWMARLAGIPDTKRLPERARFARCQAIAQALADGSGDSVAVVDSILWAAANKQMLAIEFDPHRIRVLERPPLLHRRRRSASDNRSAAARADGPD